MTINEGQSQEEKDQVPSPQKQEVGKSNNKWENDKSNEEAGKELKAVPTSIPREENSTMFKVATALSFGIAVLALFLVMVAIQKIDKNMDKLNSTVNNLDTKTTFFKNEINEKLGYVDFEIDDIKSKVKKSQRIAAIMELKRALVTVSEVSLAEESPELQIKSNQLISRIESFLQDLSEVKKNTPAGRLEIMKDPVDVPEKK